MNRAGTARQEELPHRHIAEAPKMTIGCWAERWGRCGRGGGDGRGELGVYPCFCMAGISTAPSPVASATAEPDIPAMIRLDRTLTWASPPAMCPTKARVSRKRRSVTPASSSGCPPA